MALARSALDRANAAFAQAERAHEGYRSLYEELGKQTAELVRLENLIKGLAKEVRDAIRELRKASRVSHHKLEELEEGKEEELRAELEEARARLKSIRARPRRYALGAIAWVGTILAAIIVAYLTLRFGLK